MSIPTDPISQSVQVPFPSALCFTFSFLPGITYQRVSGATQFVLPPPQWFGAKVSSIPLPTPKTTVLLKIKPQQLLQHFVAGHHSYILIATCGPTCRYLYLLLGPMLTKNKQFCKFGGLPRFVEKSEKVLLKIHYRVQIPTLTKNVCRRSSCCQATTAGLVSENKGGRVF